MPLLDPPVSRRLLWPINAAWPKRRAHLLIGKFKSCFPDIDYDMDLGVELANAQAFVDAGKRRVRLFGGLVRHRQVRAEALSFVLAHETGHHLGGHPRLQFYSWLSSEERATEWARETGLPLVFGRALGTRVYHRGQVQLQALGIID